MRHTVSLCQVEAQYETQTIWLPIIRVADQSTRHFSDITESTRTKQAPCVRLFGDRILGKESYCLKEAYRSRVEVRATTAAKPHREP